MKTEEAAAIGILLALSALAILGITALGLWSWISSALIAGACFFLIRAMLIDTRASVPTVKVDLGPGWDQQRNGLHHVLDDIKAAKAAIAANKEGLH